MYSSSVIDPRRFGGYWIVPQSLEAAAGIDWISIHTIMHISNYSWAQHLTLEELSETGLFTLSSHIYRSDCPLSHLNERMERQRCNPLAS